MMTIQLGFLSERRRDCYNLVSNSYQTWVSAMEEVTKNGPTDSPECILTLCINLVLTLYQPLTLAYFLVFKTFLPTNAELGRKPLSKGFR